MTQSRTDLIQRFVQEKHLVSSSVELLDKHTLRELFRGLAHVSQVKDLLLTLFLCSQVLESGVNTIAKERGETTNLV
jgi:hypothetical protein